MQLLLHIGPLHVASAGSLDSDHIIVPTHHHETLDRFTSAYIEVLQKSIAALDRKPPRW
jgi:hypothetical protein